MYLIVVKWQTRPEWTERFMDLVADFTAATRAEPGNLGPGWVGFNFAAAFDCPVRVLNDAAMQALGSYDGGRMLFIGLGTGLGSAFIAQHVIVPLELGGLPLRGKRPLWKSLGRAGMQRLGKRAWRTEVARAVELFAKAFCVEFSKVRRRA